jgi:transposase-like protein
MRVMARRNIPRWPNGMAVALSDLPQRDFTGRWTPKKKAAVVLCFRAGLISLEEIERRYNVSPEEYECWARNYRLRGLHGTQVNMIQANKWVRIRVNTLLSESSHKQLTTQD